MTKVVNSQEISKDIFTDIKNGALAFEQKAGRKLTLHILQVGDGQASTIYVRMKLKKATEVGINAILTKLPREVTQPELENKIIELNNNKEVDGFFIQAPISKHLDFTKASNLIEQEKDVDGLSSRNLGLLFQNSKAALAPATALAVIDLLTSQDNFSLEGKHAVIFGRSTIVGEPLAALLLSKNSSVTILHSKSIKIEEISKTADIIVLATGKQNVISNESIKEGAFIVDCGAPNPEASEEILLGSRAGYATPVPGGVGPLTILNLLKNVVIAGERKYGSF